MSTRINFVFITANCTLRQMFAYEVTHLELGPTKLGLMPGASSRIQFSCLFIMMQYTLKTLTSAECILQSVLWLQTSVAATIGHHQVNMHGGNKGLVHRLELSSTQIWCMCNVQKQARLCKRLQIRLPQVSLLFQASPLHTA